MPEFFSTQQRQLVRYHGLNLPHWYLTIDNEGFDWVSFHGPALVALANSDQIFNVNTYGEVVQALTRRQFWAHQLALAIFDTHFPRAATLSGAKIFARLYTLQQAFEHWLPIPWPLVGADGSRRDDIHFEKRATRQHDLEYLVEVNFVQLTSPTRPASFSEALGDDEIATVVQNNILAWRKTKERKKLVTPLRPKYMVFPPSSNRGSPEKRVAQATWNPIDYHFSHRPALLYSKPNPINVRTGFTTETVTIYKQRHRGDKLAKEHPDGTITQVVRLCDGHEIVEAAVERLAELQSLLVKRLANTRRICGDDPEFIERVLRWERERGRTLSPAEQSDIVHGWFVDRYTAGQLPRVLTEPALPVELRRHTTSLRSLDIVFPDRAVEYSIFRPLRYISAGHIPGPEVTSQFNIIQQCEDLALDAQGVLLGLDCIDERVQTHRKDHIGIFEDSLKFFVSCLGSHKKVDTLQAAIDKDYFSIVHRAIGLSVRQAFHSVTVPRQTATQRRAVGILLAGKRTKTEMVGKVAPLDVELEHAFEEWDSNSPAGVFVGNDGSESDLKKAYQKQRFYHVIHAAITPDRLPPPHVILDDHDVGELLDLVQQGHFSAGFPYNSWQTTFTAKGFPLPNRRPLGRPAVRYVEPHWRYLRVRDVYTLCGSGHLNDLFAERVEELMSGKFKAKENFPWCQPGALKATKTYNWAKDNDIPIIGIDKDLVVRWDLINWPTEVDWHRMEETLHLHLTDEGKLAHKIVRRAYETALTTEVAAVSPEPLATSKKPFDKNIDYASQLKPLRGYMVPDDKGEPLPSDDNDDDEVQSKKTAPAKKVEKREKKARKAGADESDEESPPPEKPKKQTKKQREEEAAKLLKDKKPETAGRKLTTAQAQARLADGPGKTLSDVEDAATKEKTITVKPKAPTSGFIGHESDSGEDRGRPTTGTPDKRTQLNMSAFSSGSKPSPRQPSAVVPTTEEPEPNRTFAKNINTSLMNITQPAFSALQDGSYTLFEIAASNNVLAAGHQVQLDNLTEQIANLTTMRQWHQDQLDQYKESQLRYAEQSAGLANVSQVVLQNAKNAIRGNTDYHLQSGLPAGAWLTPQALTPRRLADMTGSAARNDETVADWKQFIGDNRTHWAAFNQPKVNYGTSDAAVSVATSFADAVRGDPAGGYRKRARSTSSVDKAAKKTKVEDDEE